MNDHVLVIECDARAVAPAFDHTVLSAVGCLILLTYFVTVPIAVAGDIEPPTVQTLLQACESPSGSGDWLYCGGIMNGASFGSEVLGEAIARGVVPTNPFLNKLAYCPGEHGVAGAAMIQAFTNWARAHPEKWGDTGADGALSALVATWPCNP